MTRSNAREIAVHLIYACQCGGTCPEEVLATGLNGPHLASLAEENEIYAQKLGGQEAYIREAVLQVAARREELEGYVSRFAIGWKLNRIAFLARAILELAMYEALYVQDVPVAVAIDEAVRLTKKYEDEETAVFVNGVLGSFAKAQEAETLC